MSSPSLPKVPNSPPEEWAFPDYEPLAHDFKPDTWEDLVDVFEEWMTKGGADGNQGYLRRCGNYMQRVLPKDPELVVQYLRIHSGMQAWVNHRISDVLSFEIHAKALASMDLRLEKSSYWDDLKEAERRAEVARKIDMFTRAVGLFTRLKETVEERTGHLQSLNANHRTERGQPRHGP